MCIYTSLLLETLPQRDPLQNTWLPPYSITNATIFTFQQGVSEMEWPKSLQLTAALTSGIGVGVLLGYLLASRRRVSALVKPTGHTDVSQRINADRDCMT